MSLHKIQRGSFTQRGVSYSSGGDIEHGSQELEMLFAFWLALQEERNIDVLFAEQFVERQSPDFDIFVLQELVDVFGLVLAERDLVVPVIEVLANAQPTSRCFLARHTML